MIERLPLDLQFGRGLGLPSAAVQVDLERVEQVTTPFPRQVEQGREPLGRPSVTTLAPGTATTEELIKGVKRGVLITRFWYTRMVDPQSLLITGLTRDGVFLIEDGVVGPPVNNFRFNESPVTMLRNADLLGKELSRQAQGSYVPALRTHEFNLASVSEAV